jgi:LacI family transcriptional regulator
MTVSRVINDEQKVRQSTKEAVNSAIDELSYSPNQAARSLAGADLIRIGLFYDDPKTSYVSAFLIGSMQQASLRNVHLILEQCATDSTFEAAVARLASGGIDGVILPPPLSDSAEAIRILRKHKVPIVVVATGHPQVDCSAVGIDDFLASRTMTDHLISLGHTRIGFVMGAPMQEASKRRLAGYKSALVEAGMPIDDELITVGDYRYRSGLDAAEKLLSLENIPTAIFASNDEMAAAAVAVAHKRGIDVPDDLSVCGFDDTAIAETIWPELTTIRQPVADMSRKAVDVLIAKIRARRAGEQQERRHIVLDFELIRRQSDAAPKR